MAAATAAGPYAAACAPERSAFANALTNSTGGAGAGQRARLLTSATLGVWLAARIDPMDAALACDAWIAQIRTWRADAS